MKIFNRTEQEERTYLEELKDRLLGAINSLGIICKTQSQAERFHESMKEYYNQLYLLNSQSTAFVNGIIIATAHMAKGLEFDQVIMPFAVSSNYKTETDRQMLYVACTRAMHRLDLTCNGKRSLFLT